MKIDVGFDKTDVLILCGGLGKRLRSVIQDRPKPMVMVNGKPFLDILINRMSNFGFRRFVLCLGYMGEVIKKYYRDRSDSLTILFSEEKNPLGTAGGVKNAEDLIQSDPFLVMNGDSFCPLNIPEFASFHIKRKALASIALAQTKSAGDYGVIKLDFSLKVTGFNEKPQDSTNKNLLINAGIYLFRRDILSLIPADEKYSLEYNLFPRIVNDSFYGYVTEEELTDIGTPEGYKKALKILQ